MSKMTLRQKVGSLLILHTPGTDSATIHNYLEKYQPGGIIFMPDNIPPTTDQMSALTKSLQTNKVLPYLFAIDEEGGSVKRLAADNYYGPMELRNLPPSATQITFHDRSTLLKEVGINLNFGIIADVTNNMNSFIYPRVYGGDPTAVSDRVTAAVNGSKGITLTTLKHFPGHGETEANSHFTVPNTTVSFGQWQSHDAPPFQAGINAGADFVMFGQLSYSSVDNLPATLSQKWHAILRNQLHFNGISITDDMIMLLDSGDPKYSDPVKNAIDSLNAGSTMLLYALDNGGSSDISPNTLIDGIVTAIKSGELDSKLIDKNVRQVLNVRHQSRFFY